MFLMRRRRKFECIKSVSCSLLWERRRCIFKIKRIKFRFLLSRLYPSIKIKKILNSWFWSYFCDILWLRISCPIKEICCWITFLLSSIIPTPLILINRLAFKLFLHLQIIILNNWNHWSFWFFYLISLELLR